MKGKEVGEESKDRTRKENNRKRGNRREGRGEKEGNSVERCREAKSRGDKERK